MKFVRFISDDPNQKKFIVAVRKNVHNYFKENNISQKGNIELFVKAVVMLSLYIIPFVLILTIPMSVLLALLLVILMGIGEAGIGMCVMHDAAHGAFSKKQWVNKLFGSTMFLLGSNTFNWQVQHNILHHTYTNIYGYDQDIETKALIRLSNHAPLKKVHKFQHLYAYILYGLMTLSKFLTELGQLIEYNKAGITKEQHRKPEIEIIKLILIKVIYASIIIGLPLLITNLKWWQIVIGFSVLHITAGMIMSTIFQMAHVVEGAEQPLPDANGIIKNEWIIHELNATSDFARDSKFLNWYAGGLNFQIEHHLFPHTSHIHYRKIAPIVEQTAKEFGFKYNLKPNFSAALASHTKRLKELGKPHAQIGQSV